MKLEPRKYSVHILDEQFSLVSDEPYDEIIKAASIIDEIMHEMKKSAKSTDARKLALLAALKIAHRVIKIEHMVEENNRTQTELIKRLDYLLL